MASRREQRHSVLIRASLSVGVRRSDVCIRNVSSHGLMLQMQSPPTVGSQVVVATDSLSIAGQLIWQNGHKCAVRARDRIDTRALLSGGAEIPRAGIALSTAESSRLLARAIDFSTVTVVGAGFAAMIAIGVYEALSKPFALLAQALG